MTSRVYGATEDKLLAQLERNLDAAREAGAPWRVLAALIVGTAVPLSELVGELHQPADRVELQSFGDPEPQYVEVPRRRSPEWSDFVEFWDGARPLIDLPALHEAVDEDQREWGDDS